MNKKGILSIVGRPNVGKSTLFNKIVRKKHAITEDLPGVTRDRLYKEAEWQNYKFTVVDTGGLTSVVENIFNETVNDQVNIAINSSDLVLFVVDGREGLHFEDKEISNLLRQSKKKVILVINKIDSREIPNEVYEFYELGFEDIYLISAEQGFGIGDLLDKVTYILPKYTEENDDENLRVSIIGKPNVGKSSLINKLLGENRLIVTDIAGTTRDAIDTVVIKNNKEYIFVDTAGLRKKGKITEKTERYSVLRTLRAIDESHISILMIDANEGISEQDSKIIGYAHDNGKAMIILVNKWDLITKDNSTIKTFEKSIREELGFIQYVPILFISVKTGQRLNNIFPLIDTIENNYNLRIQTRNLNNVLQEAILFTPPPTDKGKRLKIFYITQLSVRPPKFALFINDKSLFHFSYLRYIENQIRKSFGFKGVPLRFELRQRGE